MVSKAIRTKKRKSIDTSHGIFSYCGNRPGWSCRGTESRLPAGRPDAQGGGGRCCISHSRWCDAIAVGQNRNLGARMRACTKGAQMRDCTHGARMRARTHMIQGENTRRHARGLSGRSLGVARLKATTWPVGVSRERRSRE